MKHVILISAIFSLFSLISCKDALLESPKAIVEENFYNTPEEIQSAINGIFPPLKDYNGFGFLYPAQLESYSDFNQGRGSYAPVSLFQGLDNTNITRVGQIWQQFYLGIRNANIVIKHLANNTSLTDADKNTFLAEAKFMRAFVYFHIVRNWGKAVLRTEDNMLTEDIPLSSASEVYQFIENDLTFAEKNLPAVQSMVGLPTSGAAKTLLADVYFTQAKYTDALGQAKDVMNSGQYSLVKIQSYDDFESDLYGPDLVTSPEEIFYLTFSRSPGDLAWAYVGFLHTASSGYYKSGALWAIYLDTLQYKVYSSWDNQDIRKQLWYSAGDFGLGPDKLLSRKFIDPGTITSGTDAGNDYPFYRYADLLLLFAESECHVNGVTSAAVEALNEVRRRGYGMDPLQPSGLDYKPADFQDTVSFINRVIKEQGYETFVEGGKRWLELKRSGKAKEIILANTGKVIADKHFLWPIPVNEMNTNKAIKPSDQNPGY